ncbi:hypothetical protein GCM10023079_47940 [Streptomyces chitinivorans]
MSVSAFAFLINSLNFPIMIAMFLTLIPTDWGHLPAEGRGHRGRRAVYRHHELPEYYQQYNREHARL